MKLNTEVHTGRWLVVELLAIAGDDSVGKSILVDDRFLEELLDLTLGDVYQWLSLYLFSEVVNDDDKKFLLTEYQEK